MLLKPEARKRKNVKKDHLRSDKHLRYIRSQKCIACRVGAIPDHLAPLNSISGHPIQAAHVQLNTGGGMGIKPPDWWTIPLCPAHHCELHAIGGKPFNAKYGLDIRAQALVFACASPDPDIRAAGSREMDEARSRKET